MKKFYKKSSVAALLVASFLLVGGASVQAQGAGNGQSSLEALQQQIQQLQERVSELRDRLQTQRSNRRSAEEATTTQNTENDGDSSSLSDVLEDRELKVGDRGEVVRKLQELLAQDESIYPEGLATGYYGPLTSQAVARLQQQIGVPDDGEVDKRTIRRVRELIENGAGNSGVTPPGLLHAPGIQRFFSGDSSTTTDEDAADDSDDDSERAERDRRGPDVDSLPISEDLKEKLRGIFSKFIGDDDDEDLSDAEEEIADAEDEIARAEEEIAEEQAEGGETEAAETRLEEARDKLNEAKAALNDGRDDEAEELAEEAEDLAGEARMKYLGKTAEEVADDGLEIEAEAEDGMTEVEVEYSDGSEEEFLFDTTDRSEVISRLVEETDLSESEIEAVLEFEMEDEDDA